MIAHAKPEAAYEDRAGYVATPSTNGDKLIVTKNGRAIAFLRPDATRSDFHEIIRAHTEGYRDGQRDSRDNIGGAYRTFLLTLGIDLEDMESKIDRLEERR